MEPFRYGGQHHHHHPHHPPAPRRVIVDTDGTIDDSLALLILLFADAIGFIRLEAITASPSANTQENAQRNIVRILEAADRTDIPVYAGTDGPFIKPILGDPGPYGQDGYGDLQWDTEPDLNIVSHKIAAIAMGKMVTENPGEIYVVGLSPPTNIALAHKLFPTFIEDVRLIHLMGGNYKAIGNINPASEYNFYVDPEAAYILLQATLGKKLIHQVAWEAILETSISLDWRWNILGAIDNPVLNIIGRGEAKIYPSTSPFYNPADAFAVAAFLYPDKMVAKEEIYPISVELHGSQTRGQCVINHSNNTTPNAKIIESLHQDFFQELLMQAATTTSDSFKVKKV